MKFWVPQADTGIRKEKVVEKVIKVERKIRSKEDTKAVSQKRNEKGAEAALNCKMAKKCGSCKYRTETYKEQLAEKQKLVNANLKSFCKVEEIIGMDTPYYYRNKVHAVFSYQKGQVISGTYQEGTHQIVPVEKCMIEDENADEIVGTIRKLLKSFKIKTYDEDTGYGLFRHVLVRTGKATGQVMVVLVLSSPMLPSKNNFVKALRKEHPEITTIVLNVNDKKTSMVLGEKETVLFGKGYIEDVLLGVRFRISSRSFYQINHTQTEILYKKAMEYGGLTGKERVVDAYCGIGTIGLIAAKDAKEVISVELNKEAIKDAIYNAKANGIKNVRFYQNDAGKFMVQMAEQGKKADVVFMDPPRAGSDEAFLSSVIRLSPKRIVYVSCNPVTLGRDLKYLTKKGYQVKKAQPVDMFPWSEHVETIVLMQKKDI